jgi:hypothetical protein
MEISEIPLSYIEDGITKCVFCESPITAKVVKVGKKKMLQTDCECSKGELWDIDQKYPICIVATNGKTYSNIKEV